ncbi:hypothetical protein FACS189452_03010 [Bacteroidia bacterium]|nr:hypothetical protein FACS189452_03010 [Bacteroidia bacterium]GHT82176.1 hypothetical protein FACS189467_7200 [Bacteroidia bacterium]
MPYRYQMNPALLNDWGFLSISPLAHWGFDAQTNFGISNFFYPHPTDNSKLITFLDNSVSSKDFLNGIHRSNEIRFDMSFNILSFGFFAWGGYNVFGIDFKNEFRFAIPKDLFAFLKNQMDNRNGTHYKIGGLQVRDDAYAVVSLGHARPLGFIDEKLTAGATLKVLLGAASAKAGPTDFDLYMSQDKWEVKLNYEAMISSVMKMNWETDKDGNVNGLGDMTFGGLGGFGLGIDLGATYQLLPELMLSAAITDLGFIKWKNTLYAASNAQPFVFNGLEGIGGDGFKLEDQINIDTFTNGLSQLRPGTGVGHTSYLNANLRLGAEYYVHKYISFGLLSTTRFSGWGTMTELMATANLKPKWFNLVLNAAISNWGPSWGLYLGWAPRYFVNMFLSVDYVPFSYTKMKDIPIPVPVNDISLSINAGATIPLNRNKLRDKPEDMRSIGTMNMEGGTAMDWQQENNAKSAGTTKEVKRKVERSKSIDKLNKEEEKEVKRMTQPIEEE